MATITDTKGRQVETKFEEGRLYFRPIFCSPDAAVSYISPDMQIFYAPHTAISIAAVWDAVDAETRKVLRTWLENILREVRSWKVDLADRIETADRESTIALCNKLGVY